MIRSGLHRPQRFVVHPPLPHRPRRKTIRTARRTTGSGPARPPEPPASPDSADNPSLFAFRLPNRPRMIGPLRVVVERTDPARRFHPIGAFDPHDRGPEIGERPRRRRTRHYPHQVDHLQARQRALPSESTAPPRWSESSSDHAPFAQRRQVAPAQPQFAVDLRVVFADLRRAAAVLNRIRAETARTDPGTAPASPARLLMLAPEAARLKLFGVRHFVHRRHWHDQQTPRPAPLRTAPPASDRR